MRKFRDIYLIVLLAFLSVSCDWLGPKEKKVDPENVMIFVSAGFNNLSSYLKQDIEDLKTGYIPAKNDKNVLLVLGHHLDGGYNKPTSPRLVRLYKDKDVFVCDTLLSLSEGARLTDREVFHEFMVYIQETFPAEHCGMVLSSHATGWLPCGYYNNPKSYESTSSGDGLLRAPSSAGRSSIFAHEYPEQDPSLPLTKSIMFEKIGNDLGEEMEISAFADAIPMHLEYMLFDCCLMGGIEVAYSLRGVTDLVGFSQTEIMSEGFDYVNLAGRLLGEYPSPKSVCEDYIYLYQSFTGTYSSATISLVDTRHLGDLAALCKGYFEKYREEIAALDPGDVQCFGGTKRYFFDLEDVLEKAGMDPDEKEALNVVLSQCIVYKGTTGQYYSATDSSTHKVDAFCGLSMFMPSAGTAFLNGFYSTLDWNKDTDLITNN